MKADHRVLGIDVGSTNIKSGLVTQGDINEFKNTPINPDKIISDLLDVIQGYGLVRNAVIGVGFPGFIDDGKVISVPNLPSIEDLNLQELLREETKHPVYVFNDADAYILGEALYGVGRDYRIVVGFTLGTGVGGGFVKDEKAYTGSHGYASEYGHMTIDPDGPQCHCGKKGCLEAFIGSYGITGHYKLLSGENRNVEEIFDRAKRGEKIALKVANKFGFYLGIGIQNVVEALDPDIVVLGGGITKAGNIILDLIKANSSFFSHPFENVKIAIGELPDKAGAIGAASWALWENQQ
jgi:glucokinase